MDPCTNPYAPGAGSPPPELAGRDELRKQVDISLKRIQRGLSAKSSLLIGLRGVGKTVLLDQLRKDAEANGWLTIRIEAPENRSLPAMLVPELRIALLRLSRLDKARDLAIRALRGLAGFVSAMKVTYNDIQVNLDFDPEPGLADNGDLEFDLTALLEVAGLAAKEAGTCFVMFVDELQYVKTEQLAALITALHRGSQQQLPITLVGAGLPQLRGKTGKAKSYAERLFEFAEIGALPDVEARRALTVPAQAAHVIYDDDALDDIIQQTQGYPYFLQEWGKHVWDAADASPVTKEDVKTASVTAIAAMDESFFRVRFDRMTPKEKEYLRAMAELGPGTHRSGDIANQLDRKVESVAPLRNNLISKGMIWSPGHGDTAFTVPLFDQFMKRIMPGNDWQH